MNGYKYQQRRRKRGLHCLIVSGPHAVICGCGGRQPPFKREKIRMIRRALDRELRRNSEGQ